MQINHLIFISIFFTKVCVGQLVVDTSYSAQYLVEKVLLEKSTNLMINDVTYTGSAEAIGYFKINSKYNKLSKKGIIISTGNVFNAIGPNTVPNKSSETYNFGDDNLSAIVNANTFDAAALEFGFFSLTDSISFNFFFASEEYPEYANKNVNDVFAFFIIDDELKTNKNIALLPSGDVPITIDNINSLSNNVFYIKNESWNSNNIGKWNNNLQQGELAYMFQYDGFSTILNVGAKVIPNRYYKLKLVIADVGDRNYDSAIFIDANSFNSCGANDDNHTLPIDLISKVLTEGVISNTDTTIVTVAIKIEFEFDSDKITGVDSYKFLEKIYNILQYDRSLHIVVNGYTDNIGTFEYNKKLSLCRAKNISEYLINKGIETKRIKYMGYGELKPISSSDRSMNRRVEFNFL